MPLLSSISSAITDRDSASRRSVRQDRGRQSPIPARGPVSNEQVVYRQQRIHDGSCRARPWVRANSPSRRSVGDGDAAVRLLRVCQRGPNLGVKNPLTGKFSVGLTGLEPVTPTLPGPGRRAALAVRRVLRESPRMVVRCSARASPRNPIRLLDEAVNVQESKSRRIETLAQSRSHFFYQLVSQLVILFAFCA
jgi:hypothetical protein